MPYHNSPEKKPAKMPKPLNKPSKTINKLQREYMKKHSKEHNEYMIKMMKLGFCIEQSHKLAMKKIGK